MFTGTASHMLGVISTDRRHNGAFYTIYADAATATTQNMKYFTCIVCVNPITMFSLQAANTTH